MDGTLKIINPWWKENSISEELAKPYRREIFNEIFDLINKRQVIILTGLRRVGKSTLIFQLIEDLLKKHPSEHLLYFSFDLTVDDPLEILDVYKELTGVEWEKEKVFLFFDEIQKLEKWGNKIKILYDHFPKLKIIVSGSSSVDLEKEAISTLTGRYFNVKVNPLFFKEFLQMKESRINLKKPLLWKTEIKKEFKEYLKKPFPEIITWESELLIKRYLKESIVDKIIRADLSARFKDVNEELLLKLVEIFYSEPGMYINYDSLSSDLKISKKTLIKHIFYLEFSYLIRKIKNLRSNALTASRKLQRIYPYHWGLLFAISEANVFESFVASMLDTKYYWREGKREVDFIIKGKSLLPVEVKSQRTREEDLKNLIYFSQEHKLDKAFLIYDGEEKEIQRKGVTIKYVPFWKCLKGSFT